MTENTEIPAYITDEQKRAFIAQMDSERAKVVENTRPIQDWENRQVNGEGMTCKKVYDNHVAKVAELRERQEAYEASLPKDPLEALAEIDGIIEDTTECAEQHYAPRAALEIIHQLAVHHALDSSDEIRDSIYWLSNEGLKGLNQIDAGSKRVRDIAHQFSPHHRAYRA